jgi:hypothetical protein
MAITAIVRIKDAVRFAEQHGKAVGMIDDAESAPQNGGEYPGEQQADL